MEGIDSGAELVRLDRIGPFRLSSQPGFTYRYRADGSFESWLGRPPREPVRVFFSVSDERRVRARSRVMATRLARREQR